MNEDDLYRTSTQYRYFSFISASLALLRATTNAAAAEHVKDAIRRAKQIGHSTELSSSAETSGNTTEADGSVKPNAANKDVEVECLTVEEEQRLLAFYCQKAIDFGTLLGLPKNVQATAVQYMKRFYLSNSLMTYHPKHIMPTALFLATKTENYHVPLSKFSEKLPKTTNEDILAPEFIVTQGLRFAFDVRHPHRGAWGGLMELTALASGKAALPSKSLKTSKQLQEDMFQVPGADGGKASQTQSSLNKRILMAQERWKEILDTAAILTDVYFLYTPSQIFLAAFLVADKPLLEFYLSTKFPSTAPSPVHPMYIKLMAVLQSCANMLLSYNHVDIDKKELTKIDKKLHKCLNPEKMNLIELNKMSKRGGGVEGTLTESAAKKRKLARENAERAGEDLFGPALSKDDGAKEEAW